MTRILIVEDNQANRDLLVYLLQAFGYELLIAIVYYYLLLFDIICYSRQV